MKARWRSPSGRAVSISSRFTVATPASLPLSAPPLAAVSPADVQSFQSAPELHPPLIAVRQADPGAPGYLFATSAGSGAQAGPMIFADDGSLIWFKALPPGQQAAGLRTQIFHGKNDLTWWEGQANQYGYGLGQDVVVNANYKPVAVVKAGNGLRADLHDFILAPGGSAFLLAYSPLRVRLGAGPGIALDCVIQEIDIHTGLVMWEWHSLGHIATAESFAVQPPSADIPFDYLHGDSLALDSHGNLLLSGRNTDALYAIDGHSGTVLWRLGGKRSGFKLGPGVPFTAQRDATWLPGGQIGLLDGGSPEAGSPPRGEIIKIDAGARTATLTRQLLRTPTPSARSDGGNLQALPGGGWMVGWGGSGDLSEFDAGGSIVYDAGLPQVLDSYRIYREPWAGLPSLAPSLSLREGTLYASWNGATTTTSWELSGGSSQSHMTPLSTTPRTGFETAITAPAAEAFYEVRALSASGRVLGTSKAIGAGGQ